ncbi:hypothetical protein ACMGT0_00560 [Pseudomonas sp. RHF3.3-3]|uniref:hypothetical protein n=1 Tax=Pseudomonas sp. RHF3.3-3 TaxID=3396624 RepID=UPI003A8525CB
MKKQVVLAALCSLFSVPALADKPLMCTPVTAAQIEVLFDEWNAALQTGDAKKVAQKYLYDAVLLPTVSNKPRLTDAERIDYFEHFLANKPSGRIDSLSPPLNRRQIAMHETLRFKTNPFYLRDIS